VENALTPARAEHGRLLLKPVLFDDIQGSFLELVGKSFGHG